MNLLNVRKLASIRIQCFKAFLNHSVAKCNKNKKSEKKGCPTDGRNVGAEKILAGDDKETMKAAKKAKFRSN